MMAGGSATLFKTSQELPRFPQHVAKAANKSTKALQQYHGALHRSVAVFLDFKAHSSSSASPERSSRTFSIRCGCSRKSRVTR
jgi:hypothetical protein